MPGAALAMLPVADTWPARRYLFFYFAPMVALALLWLRQRLAEPGSLGGRRLWIDAAVFVLSAARTWGVLPFSGHMLFLVHGALTARAAARASTRWRRG